jgi:hypothetical protein
MERGMASCTVNLALDCAVAREMRLFGARCSEASL